jgi:hypothetical protein
VCDRARTAEQSGERKENEELRRNRQRVVLSRESSGRDAAETALQEPGNRLAPVLS